MNKAMRNDKMISLVERMLALHKQSPRSPQEQEMVKREIESTDRWNKTKTLPVIMTRRVFVYLITAY